MRLTERICACVPTSMPGVPLAVIVAVLGLFSLIQSARAEDCAPVNHISFICGVSNVEDFAPIPNSKWVIGGGLAAAGTQGYLYLFDTVRRTGTAVQPSEIAIRPDKKMYPDCPGPVDWKVFGPHGLDLSRIGGTHRVLYVANHGGRESIEVFSVDLTRSRPKLTWTGCVIAPKGFWPVAVASIPGGIVVTSLWDPADPDRVSKVGSGQAVGSLGSWYPGRGWAPVPGVQGMSGPSGVIASSDGKQIYLALWSGKQIAHIDLSQSPPKVDTAPTGMLTSNLRWAPSGAEIFAGAQNVSVKQVLDCLESTAVNCRLPFRIFRVNPGTLKLTEIVPSGVYGELGAGTGAIQVGNKLWVSTLRGDRIGVFPAK
jgi:hypothetical protein